MKILYIDTTTSYLYTGLVVDKKLVSEVKKDLGKDLSSYTLKEIDTMLKQNHLEPNDIDKIIQNQYQTIDKLKKIKTSMLKLLFPQDKVSYPMLRFKNYTDAWEQQYINANLFPKIKKYPTTAYYY